LFSATVAVLVAVSIQDLRPNPQDISAFYLKNILQLLADPNVSRASILATSTEPPPFSPPKFAIWVNSLWLLSLVIGLTCALLATLLQQWARRYVTITQPPRSSPHKRARVRAFFADGVERFHLPWAVETLPTLLHVSLFLFFFGLLILLFNINHTTFNAVVWWVVLSAIVYGCITLMPIFRHDSPYYAPLSFSAWVLFSGVSCAVFRLCSYRPFSNRFSPGTRIRCDELTETYRKRFLGGILKATQESASTSSAEADRLILKWTFDALDEDHEFEEFFEAIPGFCTSNVVHDPPAILRSLGYRQFGEALHGFHTRTLSSSLLSISETVRERRLMVYKKAAEVLDSVFLTYEGSQMVFYQDKDRMLQSVQMGEFLINRFHSGDHDGETAFYARGIVAGIVANAHKRDNRWETLVKDQLGISDDVLRDYLAHGDSVLLANLIHIARRFFRAAPSNRRMYAILNSTLWKISKFDIQLTLPGLQHDFCTLWNEVRREAYSRESIPFWILISIRQLYNALHQGTNAVPTVFDPFQLSSYPLCNIPDHHSHGATDETITSSPAHLPDPDLNSITPTSTNVTLPVLTLDHNIRIHFAEDSSLHDAPESNSIPGSLHCSPPVDDTLIISPMANSKSDPRPATTTPTPHISPLSPNILSIDQCDTDLGLTPPSSVPGPPFHGEF
jgi:Family of unknown function (DUF6535)